MSDYLLESRGVTKSYGTTVKTHALRGIDLGFRAGELASIIGQSGSGKTTFLNIIGALDRPTNGSLWFRGRELSSMTGDELAAFRNQNIGFIFQFHHLLPEFSALENVLIPTWIFAGRGTKAKLDRGRELLKLVGLEDRIGHKATEMSGGQQQRVAIARALINEPAIVLADEPTGNLDSDATRQVYQLMRGINRRLNTAFVVVTHDDRIAAKSDRVVVMNDGRIEEEYSNPTRD